METLKIALLLLLLPVTGFASENGEKLNGGDEGFHCAYKNKSPADVGQIMSNKGTIKLAAFFAKADRNDDKKLSVREAVTAGMNGNMFVVIDNNHDHFITPSEVNIWLKRSMATKLWTDFQKTDRDQNLCLSDYEIGLADSPLAKHFSQIDRNHDRCVSFKEMVTYSYPKILQDKWYLSEFKRQHIPL